MEKFPFNPKKELGFQTNRTGRLLKNNLRRNLELSGHRLQGEQLPIMLHLWAKDGRNQQELADAMIRDKATIARAIHHLEKAELVVRIEDEKDKRNNRIFLTRKGKTMREQVLPLVKQLEQSAIEGVSPKDLSICIRVLEQVYNNLT